MNIPALNEIARQALGYDPKYPENAEERDYIILFEEDYQKHGVDMVGNVALLVDKENAKEIKRLAEKVITDLEEKENE